MTVARPILAALRASVDAWQGFWFSPMAASTLALFRIAMGVLVFCWTLSLAPELSAMFSSKGILPRQPVGPGVWGLLGFIPGKIAVIALFSALLVASACLVVGFWTRIMAVVVFVGVMSFERRNPWVFSSGDGLIRNLAFFLMLAPAGAALSVDRWRKARERFWEFPLISAWPVRLLQVQLSILYLSTVWAKLRGMTWNDGTAVSYALRIADLGRFRVLDFLAHSPLVTNALTYATLAIEFSLGILVWNKRLRPWVLALGVLLHFGTGYVLRLGFFVPAILTLYLAFLSPGAATRLILAAGSRLANSRLARTRLRPFFSAVD
ncbi:MAG: HTTM domain-containing protein [Actinomycetota bacterium]|nr:HTTM domain-containing protein [Actinomycetota bacterium]